MVISVNNIIEIFVNSILQNIWRTPSLSELTMIIFDIELIHFGSRDYLYHSKNLMKKKQSKVLSSYGRDILDGENRTIGGL